MTTLLSEVKEQLGPQGIEQLSRTLGADKETVEKATAASIPLLLTALSRNAAEPEGAQSLYTALEEDHDGSVLGNLDAVYANPQAFDGAEILGHIFGANREPVEGDLSKGTGLNPNATALLLQILAPIVMGLIGKKLRGSGMDAGGLSGLLGGQTKEAEAAQPGLMGSITKILDRNSDGSVLDDLQRFAGGLFGRKDN